MAFNYFTYGAACSEVEIDCLTGDHQVIRSDIVMDLGSSLNPAIDIGQIEGRTFLLQAFCLLFAVNFDETNYKTLTKTSKIEKKKYK